jgi:phenylacetate-CoA ligase
MDKMAIYYKLPIFAQNLACYYEGSRIRRNRFGKDFWRLLSEYESRNKWPYEQIAEYRDSKLREMIKHCYKTVPYYQKLFNEHGIDYNSIRTIDDLKVLPILTKQVINENFNDFISTAIPKNKMVLASTGGTTGSGFAFYTTKEAISEQWAVWWRYRRNLGIKFNTWCGSFGGKTIVPRDQQDPPFWRVNAPCKQIYFSGFHINQKNWKAYVDEIKKKEIKWLHGYPSNIANLASYIISNGVKIDVEYVSIGAENLLDYQIQNIQQAFGVKPVQHYGAAEGVANISEKLDGNLYVDEDFSAVEFVQHDESTDRIIGTSLTNWAMPFLRYDTGDLVPTVNKDMLKETLYGRKVESIDGRQSEFLVLQDGTKISGAVFNLVFKEITSIKEGQIIQKDIDKIIVRIVKNNNYTTRDENILNKTLKERLGENVKFVYEYVDEIEKTVSGKLRAVVSEL